MEQYTRLQEGRVYVVINKAQYTAAHSVNGNKNPYLRSESSIVTKVDPKIKQ